MIWLDHLLFGCGRGLKSPCFDDQYYWLSGRLYHFIGGLGAQLSSFQWFTPKPGERRTILGRDFVPYQTRRTWLRVRVSWRIEGLPQNIDEATTEIRRLKQELNAL